MVCSPHAGGHSEVRGCRRDLRARRCQALQPRCDEKTCIGMAVVFAAQGADSLATDQKPAARVEAAPRPPFPIAVPPGPARVLLLRNAGELAALVQDWEELARAALEPNPFYE